MITYDIADDKRRTRVYKNLRNWGDRVQYSVFLADLTHRELKTVEHILSRLIHHEQDQVLFADLGRTEDDPGAIVATLGKPYEPPQNVLVI